MTNITTILFDFDGVIAHTEPQYDQYMDNIGKTILKQKGLAAKVKGSTTPAIIQKHFSHLPSKQIDQITSEFEEFERNMTYPEVPGIRNFIHEVKSKHYKIGLVTSSQLFKMEIALNRMNLNGIFDTIITAEDISEGKPNPICYLLAAKKLNSPPEECLVFEDSLFGIEAGSQAGMKVVGVTTTIAEEQLKQYVEETISDFTNKAKLTELLQ